MVRRQEIGADRERAMIGEQQAIMRFQIFAARRRERGYYVIAEDREGTAKPPKKAAG